MNLLLFEGHEIADCGRAFLAASDRRCRHLRTVLKVQPDQTLCAGVVDGSLGRAVVTEVGASGVELACEFDQPAEPARDVLVLAIPRPRVLLRCIESATALGFARILLVRAWRTDKSHVEASALASDELRAHAILGLEQSRRTRLPQIITFKLFKPFVEDELDARCGDATRVVAVPDAREDIAAMAALPDRPIALAIGPERGFTDYEIDALAARGFTGRRAGPHPLRVETALAYVFGQLALLRARERADEERSFRPLASRHRDGVAEPRVSQRGGPDPPTVCTPEELLEE